MARLTTAMQNQQISPSRIGLPPVLISLTKLVLRPIAAMAIAIINLPMAGKNWKKSKW